MVVLKTNRFTGGFSSGGDLGNKMNDGWGIDIDLGAWAMEKRTMSIIYANGCPRGHDMPHGNFLMRRVSNSVCSKRIQ